MHMYMLYVRIHHPHATPHATRQAQRSFCCFSHDEASVFCGDEATGDVRMWDTRSAELTGHRCKGAAGPAGAGRTFQKGEKGGKSSWRGG